MDPFVWAILTLFFVTGLLLTLVLVEGIRRST